MSLLTKIDALLGGAEVRQNLELEARVIYGQGPGRYYHTYDHAQAVINLGERWLQGPRASEVSNVQHLQFYLAALFHDADYSVDRVYFPDHFPQTNEQASAASAAFVLYRHTKLKDPMIESVKDLIRSTETHTLSHVTVEGLLLLDADLAILGSQRRDDYLIYVDQIRCEYHQVPRDEYRRKRSSILRSFLARDRIFWLMQELEPIARDNIAWELATL